MIKDYLKPPVTGSGEHNGAAHATAERCSRRVNLGHGPGVRGWSILLRAQLILAVLSLSACATTDQIQADASITIVGVGDIMLGTNYPSADYLPANRGRNLMKDVEPVLREADLTFGNLKGTILDSGPTIKNCSKCWAFRMPEYLADNLVTAGFDVVSLANNHVRDFGDPGLDNTLRVLDRLGIQGAGLKGRRESVVFDKDGVTYGFAAFAPNIGTVQINDLAKARSIVADLDRRADIVVVSFHGGAEGTAYRHVTRKSEQFYGENRGNVYAFAHAVIDAGADVVFGHGPHVTRAVEVYRDRFIAYSLGNFCTYGRFSLQGETGIAPIIAVHVDRDGRFVKAKVTPVYQIKYDRVTIDPSNRAIHTLQQLTEADGFGNSVRIDDLGWITHP